MLEVKDLVKTFGDYTAVDHVSFQIPDGKIMGLIGQNGAGKTNFLESSSIVQLSAFIFNLRIVLFPLYSHLTSIKIASSL